jgi:putative transposase
MSALKQSLGGPAIAVVAKATRRRFTVEYKRKIARDLLPTALALRATVPRRLSPRMPSAGERDAVLPLLHAPRFVDHAPAEIYATLFDAGQYLCAERTMYRLLAAHGEVREPRDQLRPPVDAAPELLPRRPNELWSWDITKLFGLAKRIYSYLYVMLDVFSRYVVGWMVSHGENATLAE